jgi:GH24 family phage-related lysozyme (muramidase)
MGWVWNVLLSCSNEEFWEDGEDEARETCEPLERINQWIPHGKLVSLIGPTYAEGVGDGIDANLFGGGYKHFDIEGFIKVVEAQDWKDRAKVQLWAKGAEEGMGEESFTLIKLRRRRSSHPKREAKPSPPSKPKPKLKTKGKGPKKKVAA